MKAPRKAIVSARSGLVLERARRSVQRGLVGLDQHLASTGALERILVTGEWWIFSCVSVSAGRLLFRTPAGVQAMPAAFMMLVPPRSLLWMRLADARVHAAGIAGREALPELFRAAPSISSSPMEGAVPTSIEAVIAAMRGADLFDPDLSAPILARRARRLCHEYVESRSPLRDIARRLHVTPEATSRSFRAGYGLPPKEYIHRARICDAVLELLDGRPILRTAFEVGFPDLRRFYAQFRRITRSTPAEYRTLQGQETPRDDDGTHARHR